MTEKLGLWATTHPRRALLLCIGFTLLAALGSLRLVLITDYRSYFDADNADRIAFAELESSFGGTDDILLVLAPDTGKVLTPESIRRIAKLADELQSTPFAERVTSVADIPVSIANASGPQIVTLRHLAERPDVNREEWARVTAEVAKFAEGTLLASDRSMAAAHVRVALPDDNDFFDTKSVLDHAEAIRQAAEAEYGDARVLLAGVLPYYHAIMQLAIRDIYLLFPICILIAALLLKGLLGSWRAAACCAIPVLLAVVTTVGLNGLFGFTVTVATLIVPIIVLVIALAYTVHLADTHLQIRAEHDDPNECARESLKENTQPILLAAGSTILGFLTMNFCISPPYQYMGTITAIGVGIAVIYVLVLMPPLLGSIDPPFDRKKSRLRRGLEMVGERFSKPISTAWIQILACGTILAILAFIPRNVVDDNISEWFADDNRLRYDNLEVDAHLTGMQQLYYQLPAPGEAGIHEPDYLKKVEAFSDWLLEQKDVVAARSLTTLVRSLSWSFGDGTGDIPADPAVTEQLLYMYEFSAPPGDNAGGLINADRNVSLIHVARHNRPSEEFQAFDVQAQQWLAENAPEMKAPPGNSGVMMFSKMALQNIPPMLWGTVLVLVFAAVVVAIALKSIRLGLISLVPNLLPIGLAFGTWALFSAHVGIALSVISAAALGIIVDDTIHFLERYKEGRRGGTATRAEGCQHAIQRVGGAITITTAVLCIGIGLLGFSDVQPTHELGLWLAIAIAYAWACDLFLLPQILIRLDKPAPQELNEKLAT